MDKQILLGTRVLPDKQALWTQLLHEFKRGDGWWQCLIVLVCLLLAFGLYRLIRRYLQPWAQKRPLLQPIILLLLPPLLSMFLFFLFLLGIDLLSGLNGGHKEELSVSLIFLLLTVSVIWLILRFFSVLFFVAFKWAYWNKVVMRVVEVTVAIVTLLKVSGVLDTINKKMGAFLSSSDLPLVSLDALVRGFLIITLTLLSTLAMAALIERWIFKTKTMALNLQIVTSRLIKVLFVTTGIFFCLAWLGFPLTSLSVFGGALGVGLGLGLQKIMSNYVSGFTLLIDRTIKIGDFVTIDDFFGQITRITTRYTVLTGVDGTEAIVPNETVLTSIINNHSYSDDNMLLSTEVVVNQASDVGLAMQLMSEAIKKERRVLQDPVPNVFFKAFADNGLLLQASFWISDPESGRMALISSINLSIFELFKEHGIVLAVFKSIVVPAALPEEQALPD